MNITYKQLKLVFKHTFLPLGPAASTHISHSMNVFYVTSLLVWSNQNCLIGGSHPKPWIEWPKKALISGLSLVLLVRGSESKQKEHHHFPQMREDIKDEKNIKLRCRYHLIQSDQSLVQSLMEKFKDYSSCCQPKEP